MTWKEMTLAEKFVHIKQIYGLAEAQSTFVKEMLNITIALQIMIFVALYAPDFSPMMLWIMPIVIVCYIAINLRFGIWLEKKRLPHEERRWGSARDPVLNNILQNQRIIMDKLRRKI